MNGASTHDGKGSHVKLGINGLGRIGKLSLWHQVERGYFAEIVVNTGRPAGRSLEDIALFIEKDSTYGSLHHYLYGCRARRVIEQLDESSGGMLINGIPVTVLRQHRNPRHLDWRQHGVELVLDATGKFRDPTLPAEHEGGSARGHLAAGAKKVVISAPFKISEAAGSLPDDAVTTIAGINDTDYDPQRHVIVSHASCTTTCLAYMLKPLIDSFGVDRILSVSMATVHASTGSQQVLDHLPKAGAKDLRRNRSIFNNIILTSTGAAQALAQVLPEMRKIPFIAESVRIPINTGSLIILVVNFQEMPDRPYVDREQINRVYREHAALDPRGYLRYTEEQNVSSDIIGLQGVAATIEGHETHTRTAAVAIDLSRALPGDMVQRLPETTLEIPITKAVIYGWYDNELGSYSSMLADRLISMAELL
ncbi:MAG: glyceraldehyde-3-phosphate dehydrogenase [Deltaproteobacteria bacterium]|nr:glyceraldehyde-3-phosphate dehydrogenase [Deltaproteobacteria bacterium]